MTEPVEQSAHQASKQLEHQLRVLELQLSREQHARASSQHKLKRDAFAQEPAEETEEESWQTTYLDMLTLILVMLVVMLAFAGKGSSDIPPISANADPGVSITVPSRALAPIIVEPQTAQTIEKPLADSLSELNTSDLGNDIEVIVNEQTISFRIRSEIIFPPAHADLSLEGLRVLKQLLPVLRSSDHLITVAGHTDNLPIRSLRYPSNWELSGARAGSVVRYLEANGISSQRMSAVGHADTRPIADNTSQQTRAINRRVELILEKPRS